MLHVAILLTNWYVKSLTLKKVSFNRPSFSPEVIVGGVYINMHLLVKKIVKKKMEYGQRLELKKEEIKFKTLKKNSWKRFPLVFTTFISYKIAIIVIVLYCARVAAQIWRLNFIEFLSSNRI